MRLFITSHSSRHGGGISVAQNLIAAFGRVAPHHDYFITIPPGLGFEACCQGVPNCRYLSCPDIGVYRFSGQVRRWLWELFALQRSVRHFRPDIIFNMANRGFLSPAAPQATLIQDPHLFYPFSQFGKMSRAQGLTFRYHRHHLQKSLRRTELLFCQTSVAAARLRVTYGTDVPVLLCPNHLSSFLRRPAGHVEVPSKLAAFQGKFKLFVLTYYYPHKNLEILPEVFERYRKELEGVVVILTISSKQSTQARALLDTVRNHHLERNIVTVGPVAQEDLPAHYAHTDALFLPTLLESFSGTYLEAMAFDRPILTSNLDFARAVCEDSAQYFDPLDVDSICQAILKLKNDAALRNRLVEAGRRIRRAESSSWAETAKEVMANLERLSSGRGGP